MTAIGCADFLREMSNLLDEDVSAELRQHLEAHLAECPTCTVLYDSSRKTIRVLAGAQAFDLPAAQLKADTASIIARIRGGQR